MTWRLKHTKAIALGSAAALDKQAIIAGNLSHLQGGEISSASGVWASGAKAWLLAQQNQTAEALATAEAALALATKAAEASARDALRTIIQTLTTKATLGDYREWVDQFVNATLRTEASSSDWLDLSDHLFILMQKITQRNGMSLKNVVKMINQSPVQTQAILDELVEQGYLHKLEAVWISFTNHA